MKTVHPYRCAHCDSCIGFSIRELEKCRFVSIEHYETKVVRPCNCGGFFVSEDTRAMASRMTLRSTLHP